MSTSDVFFLQHKLAFSLWVIFLRRRTFPEFRFVLRNKTEYKMETGRRASQSKLSFSPSKGKIKNTMATANITMIGSNDAKLVARQRAARNALQQSKIQYDRETKVIISVVIHLIFIEFSIGG